MLPAVKYLHGSLLEGLYIVRQLKSLLSTFWLGVVLEGKTTHGWPHLGQVWGLCVQCTVTDLFLRLWWL